MAAVGRIVSLVLTAIALLLLVVSFFQPWWGVARESDSTRRWERYGPFEVADDARGDDFKAETRALGLLLILAFAGLAASAATRILALARGRGTRLDAAMAGAAVAFTLALVLQPVVAFPAEVNRERGTDLSFSDRDCQQAFGAPLCYRTSPDLGWSLAVAAAVLTTAAALALFTGRADADLEPGRPVVDPRTAVVRPSAPAASSQAIPFAASSAPTGATKCPQCQTRVTYRKAPGGAASAHCHNCGLRFAA